MTTIERIKKYFETKPAVIVNEDSVLIDYKFLHEEQCHTVIDLSEDLSELMTANIDLLEKVEKLEQQNATLGNAMFEILKQDTPGGNATVKRIMNIAKNALFK